MLGSARLGSGSSQPAARHVRFFARRGNFFARGQIAKARACSQLPSAEAQVRARFLETHGKRQHARDRPRACSITGACLRQRNAHADATFTTTIRLHADRSVRCCLYRVGAGAFLLLAAKASPRLEVLGVVWAAHNRFGKHLCQEKQAVPS